MAFITDAQLTRAVAGDHATSGTGSIPAHWQNIVPRANTFAYTRIRGVLLDRGFTAAEIAGWDDREAWNEHLGTIVAFWYASKSDDDRGAEFYRQYLELIEELKGLPIIVDGEIVKPTGSEVRVGWGTYAADDDDRHTIDTTLDGL